MESFRRRLHRWTWIALAAVLGLALMPPLSHATPAAADHPWTELCSSASGQAAAPSGDSAGDIAGHGHADHCALCVHLGTAPRQPLAWALVVPGCERLGSPVSAAPFARLPWRAAQPRGPPAA